MNSKNSGFEAKRGESPDEKVLQEMRTVCIRLASEYGVDPDDVFSRCRKREVNEARWMSIYALFQIFGNKETHSKKTAEDIMRVIPFSIEYILHHKNGDYTSRIRSGEIARRDNNGTEPQKSLNGVIREEKRRVEEVLGLKK